MASHLQPIKLFSFAAGLNPWKVAIFLEELGLPHETQFMEPPQMKEPEYKKINPNGLTPAIVDPNTGITLWESGAIVQYLVEEYDKEHKLGFSSAPEKYLANQWLMYQVSGQGPTFAQGEYFNYFHGESLPLVTQRINDEMVRMTRIIDSALKGRDWLVGGRCSYADLAFVPWYWMLAVIPKSPEIKEQLERECPRWKRWIDALNARPVVQKAHAVLIENLPKAMKAEAVRGEATKAEAGKD